MPPKKANAQRPAWDDSTEAKVDPPSNDWEEKSVKKEDSQLEHDEENKEPNAWLTAKKQELPSKIAWASQENSSKEVNDTKIDWFSNKNPNKEADQSKIPWLASTQSPLGLEFNK